MNIQQALASYSKIVKIPFISVVHGNKIERFSDCFQTLNEQIPSVEEISKVTLLPLNVINNYFYASKVVNVSIDDSIFDGEGDNFFEDIENDSDFDLDSLFENESLYFEVRRVLNKLKENYSEIIRFYYGIDCEKKNLIQLISYYRITDPEITKQAISLRLKTALNSLRKYSFKKLLRPYLGASFSNSKFLENETI
jgi:DNA-directed RNA polymerase sigma subunit (sigma70/sigma32)